ncbi:MAG TPA: type II toxin-antitoxin system HigB family toxin [Hydrogenophaga sp.]|uniref:type II toxin-antitoxin system HigB family toxin n=1 Tax=Hydrogenophaga sp. TaxID=1904254 RepID=UPI002C5A345E|nr:type II toxin-antitoxin system HigB family toxin [Hydrogenophaga sp.]HSX93186.1 type II toxin-antitoxin system HigB family toxin [Hydrogenophaga sp.]
MRVIAISTLKDFWEKAEHRDAEQALKAWLEEAQAASWHQPADIKAQFRSASVLRNRRVVFNIKGNDYRLVVAVAYRFQAVYVKFVGTHAQYDAIDVNAVEIDP